MPQVYTSFQTRTKTLGILNFSNSTEYLDLSRRERIYPGIKVNSESQILCTYKQPSLHLQSTSHPVI